MPSNKRKSNSISNEEKAAKMRRWRAQDLEVKRHWRPIDLGKESFHLPPTAVLDRRPTFTFRRATFLGIFLKFVSTSLVTKIAQDIDPSSLMYDNGTPFVLSLCTIYKMLAIWIRIYGEQHAAKGVIRYQRPLRDQLVWYRNYFRNSLPNIPSLGVRFLEIVTTHFLFDSRYSKQLSCNFRSILRSIGNVVAGDEKLLHFTGKTL